MKYNIWKGIFLLILGNVFMYFIMNSDNQITKLIFAGLMGCYIGYVSVKASWRDKDD